MYIQIYNRLLPCFLPSVFVVEGIFSISPKYTFPLWSVLGVSELQDFEDSGVLTFTSTGRHL